MNTQTLPPVLHSSIHSHSFTSRRKGIRGAMHAPHEEQHSSRYAIVFLSLSGGVLHSGILAFCGDFVELNNSWGLTTSRPGSSPEKKKTEPGITLALPATTF